MKQRDLILIPFPFSDQSGQKVRPALVLSNDQFNKTSEDLIVCAVTTNLKPAPFTLQIDNLDLEVGNLYEKSVIKVETLLKIQKSLVLKTIGTLKKTAYIKVANMLFDLVKPAQSAFSAGF